MKDTSSHYSNNNTNPNNNNTQQIEIIKKKLTSHHNKSFSITSEKSKISVESKQISKLSHNNNYARPDSFYRNKNQLNQSHNSIRTVSNYSQKGKVKPRVKEKEFLLHNISQLNPVNTSVNLNKRKQSTNKIKPIAPYLTTTGTSSHKRSTSGKIGLTKKLNKSKSKEIFKIPIFMNNK